MKNVFCMECGTKHSVVASMPKFCSNCGNSMSSMSKTINRQADHPENDDEDEVSEANIPRVSKLKVQIDVGARETIGSIASAGISLDEVEYNDGKIKGYRRKSKKRIVEENTKACAPSARSKSVDEQ